MLILYCDYNPLYQSLPVCRDFLVKVLKVIIIGQTINVPETMNMFLIVVMMVTIMVMMSLIVVMHDGVDNDGDQSLATL